MPVHAKTLRAIDCGLPMPAPPAPWARPGVRGSTQLPWRWIAAGEHGILQDLGGRLSVTRQLRVANEPILLAHTKPVARYSRVLVAVDFSAASLAAAQLAAGIDAHLVFMGQFMPAEGLSESCRPARVDHVPTITHQCEATRARLSRLVESLHIRHALVSIVARPGTLDSAVGAYSHLMRPDLIVIGRRTIPRLEALLLGDLEWRLGRETGCDLLVVPEQG